MSLERTSFSITKEQMEYLDSISGEDGQYSSRSEALRGMIDEARELDELRTKVQRLENEKKIIIDQYQQSTELEKYREESDLINESSFTDRLRWFVFGKTR